MGAAVRSVAVAADVDHSGGGVGGGPDVGGVVRAHVAYEWVCGGVCRDHWVVDCGDFLVDVECGVECVALGSVSGAGAGGDSRQVVEHRGGGADERGLDRRPRVRWIVPVLSGVGL